MSQISTSNQSNLITVSKIPKDVQKIIRDSFSYQGLVKALNSGIISREDIEKEADFEQKNPDLLMDQRVHTVLLFDLKNNQVSQDISQNSSANESAQPIPLRHENSQTQIADEPDISTLLFQATGFKVIPNWKGLDKNHNFIEITAVEESGWVKFCSFNKSREIECFSYPLSKFIKYFQENNIFEISPDDYNLVTPDQVKNLDEVGRIALLKEIQNHALSKLQQLKIQKRGLVEKILRTNENKKLEEILARIKA